MLEIICPCGHVIIKTDRVIPIESVVDMFPQCPACGIKLSSSFTLDIQDIQVCGIQ